MIGGPFQYFHRLTAALGVGQGGTAPVQQDSAGPFMVPDAYIVTTSLRTMSPQVVYANQHVTFNDLIGNGMALNGALALQQLIDLQNQGGTP